MLLYNNLTTYPGDLWNFFVNYLERGLRYPPEYPAGLRFFYEIMGFREYESYTAFFTVNALILGTFALATTYLLYLILRDQAKQTKTDDTASAKPDRFAGISKLWYFWILAPSFIFYGMINYDFPVVFLIVLAVYLFTKEKYYSAVFFLGVGMVVKVFPAFLLPIFIWRSPAKLRLKLILLFLVTVILLNLPYALSDFQTWIYPYLWQISSNLTTGPSQYTYWWLVYPLTGKLTGWLSLVIFGSLYIFSSFKMRKAGFIEMCLVIIILFLLTDRVYSSQYNLYLLPFLVLTTYRVNKVNFYLIEILTFLIIFFCFFLKAHPVYLQTIVFVRYFALIWLLVSIMKQNSITSGREATISKVSAPTDES